MYEFCKTNGKPLHPIWKDPKGHEGYQLENGDIYIFKPDRDKYLCYRKPIG